MCGIVGAVAHRNVVPILLEGLKRMEYRGYDSCGVAVHNRTLRRARGVARVEELQVQVSNLALEGCTGIAHTRWATHGKPASCNAHPHFSAGPDGEGNIGLVHNGIIENYETLRLELGLAGYIFDSQTDTEAIAHLIDHLYDGDLLRTVQQAVKRLTGTFAIAVFCRNEPDRVIGVRRGCPLVVGLGERENFVASDAMAFAGASDRVIYLEDGDIADIRQDAVYITDRNDLSVNRPMQSVQACSNAVKLGSYRHYMQKEIFEQPDAIENTLDGVRSFDPSLFGPQAAAAFSETDRVLILACGTSYYSGMTAKYWLEAVAGMPTDVEIASEYRYRIPVSNPKTLVLVISQSGETADTLAALAYAQERGHRHTLAICNVPTSAMMRQTELHYLTRAGVEIGVASTKAFTTQLTALFLLALTLAKLQKRLSAAQEERYLGDLRRLPDALRSVLALEPLIASWAEMIAQKENALFLGRGLHYPIALEGALKLKEITYIHAEAYPAGELKHGPLALVTSEIPVITVAPNDQLIEKLKSNMQEVQSRGGRLYVFADAGSQILPGEGMQLLRLPAHLGLLSPILHVVPLQLLAYHTALIRGTDVDKPRNLAKSVTVE